MMEKYILDENDCPQLVSIFDYFKWQKSLPEQIRTGIGFRLARTESPQATVSTVYLGSDHGYGEGPPLLWETMVFCDGDNNEDCLRASSREEAMTNHQALVKKYIDKVDAE